MIEKTVMEYLDGQLDVNCYMEVPASRPERFVVVEKTGSSRENYINSSMLAIKSYAPSLYEAAALNEQVKTVMDTAIELDEICRADINSDYVFNEINAKGYRYQAVYDIIHY